MSYAGWVFILKTLYIYIYVSCKLFNFSFAIYKNPLLKSLQLNHSIIRTLSAEICREKRLEF